MVPDEYFWHIKPYISACDFGCTINITYSSIDTHCTWAKLHMTMFIFCGKSMWHRSEGFTIPAFFALLFLALAPHNLEDDDDEDDDDIGNDQKDDSVQEGMEGERKGGKAKEGKAKAEMKSKAKMETIIYCQICEFKTHCVAFKCDEEGMQDTWTHTDTILWSCTVVLCDINVLFQAAQRKPGFDIDQGIAWLFKSFV